MPPGTGSIALVPVSSGMMGFAIWPACPGILYQPAFQALPGRMTQVLDHLGCGHRRGGAQVHRALSFLGTGHMIIFSFDLQENIRSPLSVSEVAHKM
jgi:hypothetical protein